MLSRQWPGPPATPCRRQETGRTFWHGRVWPWRTLLGWWLGPWGIPPLPGSLPGWGRWCRERVPESQAPACCPHKSLCVDRASVPVPSSGDSERLSCFSASQGIPGVFTKCPWVTGGDLRHFSPNTGTVALDRGVGEQVQGRSSLDLGDIAVASGWAFLEPSLPIYFSLWVTP